jgi:crotonobetainyl-CoA:carnitine CoA-transferase CaiB-like acyl-CoA transferase
MANDFFRGIDWQNFSWEGKTQEDAERIHDYIGRFFQSKTKVELAEEALRRDIMIEPVASPKDILSHHQLQARGYWQAVEYPESGTILYPRHFCLLSETPSRIKRRAPLIGEHNQEIYPSELGLSDKELATLKQRGII